MRKRTRQRRDKTPRVDIFVAASAKLWSIHVAYRYAHSSVRHIALDAPSEADATPTITIGANTSRQTRFKSELQLTQN
jgi:hypothetical protein